MKEFVCTEDFIGYLGREYKKGDIVDERNYISLVIHGTAGREKFVESKRISEKSVLDKIKDLLKEEGQQIQSNVENLVKDKSKNNETETVFKKKDNDELETYLKVLYVASTIEAND